MPLITRASKGSELEYTEVDGNFLYLYNHSNLENRLILLAHPQYSLTSHTHSMSQISGTGAFSVTGHTHDQYSLTSHTHSMSQISGTGAFSVTSHTHDTRYYQQSEIDLSLAGKSSTAHTHPQYATTAFALTLQPLTGGLSSQRPINPRDFEQFCDITLDKIL